MFGSPSSSSTPAPPPIPDPPPNPASFGASTFAAGRRNTASSGSGFGSTILTGGQGLTAPANTQRKTLLGQ